MTARRWIIVLVAVCVVLLTACDSKSNNEELIVLAASSLTNVVDDLARAYEAEHPGVQIRPSYGPSSGLATQLVEGAPADIFLSANQRQMSIVANARRITGTPVVFAANRLVLIVPADNPADVQHITDLFDDDRDLRLVLAAPGVPARVYADQMFSRIAASPDYTAGDVAVVYEHLASEERNVRQVAAKVALGEADAGIVYVTDVTPDIAGDVIQIAVPEEYNVTASYTAGIVSGTPHTAHARDFVDFVLSSEGQIILARRGFSPPSGER